LDVAVSRSGPYIDPASHASLLAPVTCDVIKQALFSIDDNKASGPDGYTSLFFKKSWDIVGSDFCHAVHDFFVSEKLLKQINHSIIALIPKSANVTSTADFRPISCCNVVYKVISKILSARLVVALADIISPLQNAFLGGRVMANNIHIIQELLRLYERKHVSPRCLMKVDLKKAFNTVQWPFLQQLLLSYSFPNRFVHRIMQCVETTFFSIVVNGNIYGLFQGKNGVRRGDLLSHYLFIAYMEYLSRMLKMASMNSNFIFHPKCRPLGINHLAFADDIILLSRGDRQFVACLCQQLISFGHISGLAINREKSSIYFSGVGEQIKQVILQDTGFMEGLFPFHYLGVPLSPHRLLVSQYSPLLQKLESVVQCWQGKHLNYAGRVELIKSVLFGMMHFWLNIFPLPGIVIKQIICICRNFMWTSNVLKSNSALVAWKTAQERRGSRFV
jgi:hypothetical protein